MTRGRRAGGSTPRAQGGGSASAGGARPALRPAAGDGEIDWERVAVFGTGIALGAALGAGVALLFAPHSGEEVRAALLRRGARLAGRSRDAWEDLRGELQWAARRGKRRVGRRVQRARWAAEDFVDERRRPDRWRGRKPRAEAKDQKRVTPEIDDAAVEEIVDALGG